MLRLKYQFENFAEIYIIPLFTHFYALLNFTSMLIPNLSVELTISRRLGKVRGAMNEAKAIIEVF